MVVAVAVKFGVGVALVVAAHFVLVRRWNNGKVFNFYTILRQHIFYSCSYEIYIKKRKNYLYILDVNQVEIIILS